MNRVLVGAGIFTAIMAATTGQAADDDGPTRQTFAQQTSVGLIAEPSSGSAEIMTGVLFDIVQMASGSSGKCDGLPPGFCTPYPT